MVAIRLITGTLGLFCLLVFTNDAMADDARTAGVLKEGHHYIITTFGDSEFDLISMDDKKKLLDLQMQAIERIRRLSPDQEKARRSRGDQLMAQRDAYREQAWFGVSPQKELSFVRQINIGFSQDDLKLIQEIMKRSTKDKRQQVHLEARFLHTTQIHELYHTDPFQEYDKRIGIQARDILNQSQNRPAEKNSGSETNRPSQNSAAPAQLKNQTSVDFLE
jgi:hypothetical protein